MLYFNSFRSADFFALPFLLLKVFPTTMLMPGNNKNKNKKPQHGLFSGPKGKQNEYV